MEGWQVDDVARTVIASAGYANFYVHRTGHSITTSPHGDGANMDNFETQDARRLLPRTCCSVEPGIYLPGWGGVRIEDLVVLEQDGARVLCHSPRTLAFASPVVAAGVPHS